MKIFRKHCISSLYKTSEISFYMWILDTSKLSVRTKKLLYHNYGRHSFTSWYSKNASLKISLKWNCLVFIFLWFHRQPSFMVNTYTKHPTYQNASYCLNNQYCPGRNANIFWYLGLDNGQGIINTTFKSNQVNETTLPESKSRESFFYIPCKAQTILYQETTDLI